MESTAADISLNSGIDDSGPESPENIALKFADGSPSHSRKKGGVFYTPCSIVDEILSTALRPLLQSCSDQEIFELRVVDPACGSGIFLIRAFRTFIQELVARDPSNSRHAHLILRNCLFGVDCDPNVVALARTLLLSCARQYSPHIPQESCDANILVGNSLLDLKVLDEKIPEELQPFDWKKNFPIVFASGGFDCVVGNPPYGLSRAEQISPLENQFLQKIYAEWRDGKINKYLAFIALGYRLLKPKGILSFIVPNAWLGVRSAIKLRATLLRERALHAITIYDYPVFADPSVESVVFYAQKDSPQETISISRRSRTPNIQSETAQQLPVSACLASTDFKIPTLWREDLAPVISKLLSHPLKLGSKESPYIPRIALQAYAKGKGIPPQTLDQVKTHCFHCPNPERGAYPYLEGADIGRYKLKWSGNYLRYGKFLAEPQVLSRFEGPRVLLREILNPAPNVLGACYTESTSLYNKSVLHVTPKHSNQAEMMQALCVLLNSSLISFFIRMCGCKSQRSLFPKIVNDDLRSIPLTDNFFSAVPMLAQYCRQQLQKYSQEFDQKSDALIYDAYGIDERERVFIANFLTL